MILSVLEKIVNEQADMEIESLQIIYPDECKILPKQNGLSVISMFIPARFGKQSYASVDLIIKLPLTYPKEMYDIYFHFHV